jgi:hypothetical protein
MALDQIGQKLKSARESHGLSLSQIFERTKIPINHLESIDNGLSDELPEPVYVAGYIKRYADCVGLNGQGLSDEYRKLNGGGSNGSRNNGHSMVSSRMAAPVIVSAPSYGGRVDVRAPNILKQGLFYSLMIVTVVGIMALLFWWQSNYSMNQNQTDPAQTLLQRRYNTVITAPTQTAAPGQPQAAPGVDTSAPAPLPSDNESAISITAGQHVWVEVSAVSTGQNLYTGYMERGDRKDYKDAQGLRVRARDGAALSIENQGKTETLGTAGKASEKVFMSKAAAAPGTTPAAVDAKAQAAAAKAAAVKKVVKKAVNPDAAPRHRAPSGDAGAGVGGSGGGHSSIDVPYRYTESND